MRIPPQCPSSDRWLISKSQVFSKNGINTDNENIAFSVDSYSYFISVEGASSDEMKTRMEQALNTGDNGKMLWMHINSSSNIQGADSTQVSQDKLMKHSASPMETSMPVWIFERSGSQMEHITAETQMCFL